MATENGTGSPPARRLARWMRVAATAAGAAVVALTLTNLTAQAANQILGSGQTLSSGQSMNTGTGCSLVVQATDGNVVEYCNGVAHWATASNPNPGDRLVMQGDGNAVVYTSGNAALWSTGTFGYNGAYLDLQDDQNLVVYTSSGTPVWAVSWEHDAVGAQTYAQDTFFHYGWSISTQWSCLYNLWQRESGWRWNATNPSSGAYGIPQALPGSKMATAGTDWQSGGLTQVHWGEDYISGRYGNPCSAWSHEQTYGWY